MQSYKLHVLYNGLKFSGFQTNTSFLSTIQDCIELAINVSYPGLKTYVKVAGRTDAGVHSTGQAIQISVGKLKREYYDPVSYASFNQTLNKSVSQLKVLGSQEDTYENQLKRKEILSVLNESLKNVKIYPPNNCIINPTGDDITNIDDEIIPQTIQPTTQTSTQSCLTEQSLNSTTCKNCQFDTNTICTNIHTPNYVPKFCDTQFSDAPTPNILLHTLNSKLLLLFGPNLPIKFSKPSYTSKLYHPRFAAYRRTYVYRIACGIENTVFEQGRAWCVPHSPNQFDIDRARKAAQFLIGQHDFSAFRYSKCQATLPQRSIDSIRISYKPSFLETLQGAPLVFEDDNIKQKEIHDLAQISRGGTMKSAITSHTAVRKQGWYESATAQEMQISRDRLFKMKQEMELNEFKNTNNGIAKSDPRDLFLEFNTTLQSRNDENITDNTIDQNQIQDIASIVLPKSHLLNSKQDSKTDNMMAEVQPRNGSIITIELTARSYLHSQVRKIVGSLYAVATNKYVPISSFYEGLINGKLDQSLSKQAPAEGLFLTQVLCADGEEEDVWYDHHRQISIDMVKETPQFFHEIQPKMSKKRSRSVKNVSQDSQKYQENGVNQEVTTMETEIENTPSEILQTITIQPTSLVDTKIQKGFDLSPDLLINHYRLSLQPFTSALHNIQNFFFPKK